METRLKVQSVGVGGTAEYIGLQAGDILETFNGIQLYTSNELQKAIANNTDSATLILFRNHEQILLDVIAGPWGITAVEVEHTPNIEKKLKDILVSTTPCLEGYRVTKTIDIVSAECVFGMNIFKDFFMGLTDLFGGRSGSAQEILRTARVKCLQELRIEALNNGANAIIGVDLDYSEISGKGTNMLFLVATGTAVIVEKIQS